MSVYATNNTWTTNELFPRLKRRIPAADKREQKGAWGPGNYANTCFSCNEQFVGDKRAVMCADCAYGEN